jgi:hypothetical protein
MADGVGVSFVMWLATSRAQRLEEELHLAVDPGHTRTVGGGGHQL